jgi:hypothetical protein
MTDLRKAAEQALETLERLDKWLAFRYGKELLPPEREVVEALRQALQQQEQKSLGHYPADMMAKVNSLSISDGDKPRALRFAEMLMNPIPTTTDAAIALELRRLHEENQALRTALAQQEQEPVYAFRRKGLDDFCTCDKLRYDELVGKPNLFEVTVFYHAPPKRKWVGLTDADIDAYALDEGVTADKAPPWLVKYARDIEAFLKDKNT